VTRPPLFIVAAVLVGGASAYAQSADKPGTAPTVVEGQQPPAAVPASSPAPAAPQKPVASPAPQDQASPGSPAVPAAPAAGDAVKPLAAPPMTQERLQRIYHIRQLEGMFTNAVKAGANSVANQLQVGETNSLFVNGSARTRGFELEGYGVFFDIDVPTMMQSAVWATQVVRQQQYVNSLNNALADPTLDPSIRRVAESELARIQRAMARGQLAPIPIPAAPVPALPGAGQAAAQGLAVAQTTDAGLMTAGSASPPVDPNELYTETIKGALIDAMLSYGGALRVADNEWLTVAARATSQAAPTVLDDSSSIVLRIKGSDLSAFLTGKITREEAIKRIETKES